MSDVTASRFDLLSLIIRNSSVAWKGLGQWHLCAWTKSPVRPFVWYPHLHMGTQHTDYYLYRKMNTGLRNKVVFYLGSKQIDSSSVYMQMLYLLPFTTSYLSFINHCNASALKWLNTLSVIKSERQSAGEGEYFPKHSSSPIIWFDMTLSAGVVIEHEACCQSWLSPSLPLRSTGRAEGSVHKDHKLFIIPHKLYIKTTSKLSFIVYVHIHE